MKEASVGGSLPPGKISAIYWCSILSVPSQDVYVSLMAAQRLVGIIYISAAVYVLPVCDSVNQPAA